MADVKWIKIVTDIFDDEKMLLIDSLPEKDGIIVIWFKLLCLAGKQNNGGVLMFNDRIAYTDEMLATIFRRPINTVKFALNVFQEYGMIEIINGAITIPKWEKHQRLESMEVVREQTRNRVRKYREKQKQIASNAGSKVSDVTVTLRNADRLDIDIDKDIDNILPSDEGNMLTAAQSTPRIDYKQISEMYNSTCVSLPRVTSISEARKKAIAARFHSGHTIEDFMTVFTKAEASAFLKGKNNRNWTANFDWLIKDANFSKTLDGNYDDKTPKKAEEPDYSAYEVDFSKYKDKF